MSVSVKQAFISVSITPGSTQFTRIPEGASSLAWAMVIARSPDFDALYASFLANLRSYIRVIAETYAPLEKQNRMMQLVLAYYDEGLTALERGCDIEAILNLTVREQIGRFKYIPTEEVEKEYERILLQLKNQMAEAGRKEEY